MHAMTSHQKPEIVAAQRAVELLGGPVKTARLLGVNRYQTVQSWTRYGVPVEYCADIERLTDAAVTRRDLCPTNFARIWHELADQQPAGQGAACA